MPALPILAKIAKEAGDKILSMQHDVIANERWEIKDDQSSITIADKEANQIICSRLKRCFPNIPIMSEENSRFPNKMASKASEYFCTDPLDNTDGYKNGKDGFSVNIGRIKDGLPVDGVIYFPKKQELYFTGDNGKAYLQQGENPPKEIHVKKGAMRDVLQVATGFNEQNITHMGNTKCQTKNYPGQMRACMVARGDCDITGIASAGFNSWDTAGPHAVLLAAGGDMVAMDGKPIRYNNNSIKLPEHISGSKDVLLALGLSKRMLLNSGQNIK